MLHFGVWVPLIVGLSGTQCIVSEAARVSPAEEDEEGSDRFWDPRSRTSFRFDHIALVSLI